MNEVSNLVTAIVVSSALFIGTVYTIKTVHDQVRTIVLEQISEGLSSSEKLANALTGERLDF